MPKHYMRHSLSSDSLSKLLYIATPQPDKGYENSPPPETVKSFMNDNGPDYNNASRLASVELKHTPHTNIRGCSLTPPTETTNYNMPMAKVDITLNPPTPHILKNFSLFSIWKNNLCENIDYLFSQGHTIPEILQGIQTSFQIDSPVDDRTSLVEILDECLQRIDLYKLDNSDYNNEESKQNLLTVVNMFFSEYYKLMKRKLALMQWDDSEFDNLSDFITRYGEAIRFVEPDESISSLIKGLMKKLPSTEANKLKWIILFSEQGDIRTWREAERLIRHELLTENPN
ncbi:hypothetical protein NADFUDRAFT_84286 [Nadsonia fulvescens var. elongata DSM 6958]|uniref:Uncharacterized protein n=1 Tax=Nadsonia fulvescens var. elongata DSM 6958 TaxID=857566 RepID=A0A1E3PE15_9ASCO|nr:hypothetical protein NADFUDRAFT_84286 [Nadsonia fulvescens var. elongata DSM 6958]